MGALSVAISVRDRGPGLADDQLERAFEPYVRYSAAAGAQPRPL